MTNAFKLFGYRITFQTEESDSCSTAPENPSDEESTVLSPEPVRIIYLYEICMPAEFLQRINPARSIFLYRKELTNTDMDNHQNRLLVTDTNRLNEFLTEEEREMTVVDAIAVGVNGIEFMLRLSKWGGKNERKRIIFILCKGWSSMVRSNEVAASDFVDMWGFRRGSNNELRLVVFFTKRRQDA